MNKIPLLLAPPVFLLACARTEPVSEEELSDVVVETPALADPEVADDGPDALPANAMQWRVEDDTALLAVDPASPLLSIACGEDDNGIVLTRYGVEGSGSAGTLTIVGNGASARVPVVAAEAAEEGEFHWTATLARGELASNIRTAFAEDEPVNITATSVDPIVVAANPELRGLLARCVGGEIGDAPLLAEEAPAAE
ncbi:hypothetical protein [Sphingomicrobium astaxanthinifaciens]|uniref:hypothetical protein n=1 Tax=Sphingomicrobium astaxanthinifaciens TaxID=1227949 RepID=UPI001FCAAF10|nr:hypothetical protein [Sphingomicrobium astaxanthinifaciens]MCJ7421483.1 hypothetical protein [Sphingomicrobium astaxanthinifaciens]